MTAKTVLIVDDEPLFLSSVRQGLASRYGELDILGAAHGHEALDILRSRPVDLVVTDLRMPVMDGFELLGQLMKEERGTPVIVMTAYGTPDLAENARGLGAVAYVEKPIELQALGDKIARELQRAARGHIQGITLFGFLQLLQLERKTCTLKVASGGRTGALHFQDGELIHAEVGDVTGPEAVYALDGWTAPEIEIDHVCRSRRRTVFESMTELLLEGARRLDEKMREEGLDGDFEAALEIEAEGAPEPEGPWNGQPAVRWWEEAGQLLRPSGLPGLALGIRLTDGATVPLLDAPDAAPWAEPVLALIRNALDLAGEPGPGVFEWIHGQTGFGIVWTTAPPVAVAIADRLPARSSVTRFRSQLAALARQISETSS